jgi:hypothetical protein
MMIEEEPTPPRALVIKQALRLTTEALDLLDAHNGPPEAAAYSEMARDQLRRHIKPEGTLEIN